MSHVCHSSFVGCIHCCSCRGVVLITLSALPSSLSSSMAVAKAKNAVEGHRNVLNLWHNLARGVLQCQVITLWSSCCPVVTPLSFLSHRIWEGIEGMRKREGTRRACCTGARNFMQNSL